MHEELRIVILKVKKCFESNESSCESGYSKNNQSYNAQGTFILKLVQSALQSSFARFVWWELYIYYSTVCGKLKRCYDLFSFKTENLTKKSTRDPRLMLISEVERQTDSAILEWMNVSKDDVNFKIKIHRMANKICPTVEKQRSQQHICMRTVSVHDCLIVIKEKFLFVLLCILQAIERY